MRTWVRANKYSSGKFVILYWIALIWSVEMHDEIINKR